MEKAHEFSCPICGSTCQTPASMRGKEMECLMCFSKITVPDSVDERRDLEMGYFLNPDSKPGGTGREGENTDP